jgi:hypothetical protein
MTDETPETGFRSPVGGYQGPRALWERTSRPERGWSRAVTVSMTIIFVVLTVSGCRRGNSVVPQPSGPPVATICERPGEVMQGFLMQGAERIAVCCPVPAK